MNMINSRKLGIQSLVTLTARVEELYDEEAPIAVHGEEKVEYRRMPLELAQIAIAKNDIFRLKEEVALPSNYPNIFQILWNNISLGDVEFKVMEEKITISGDIHVFILYEGEGEDHPCRSFETVVPFSGVLECHGCREGMLPDIRYHLGQQELAVRPDFDGEERNVGLELVLDISIRIYEEEKLEIISDLYGVSKEVGTVSHRADLRRLLAKVTGKTKVTDHVRVTDGTVLQLLHSEGSVTLEQRSTIENGILVQGALQVKILYITGEDEAPYGSTQAFLPYRARGHGGDPRGGGAAPGDYAGRGGDGRKGCAQLLDSGIQERYRRSHKRHQCVGAGYRKDEQPAGYGGLYGKRGRQSLEYRKAILHTCRHSQRSERTGER